MNKAELIEALAVEFDGSKAQAAKALNAVVDTITHSTARGEKVSITGFGVFEKVKVPSRMVRNPRTGERKRAKATAKAKFRPGSELKAYVSGEKKPPRATAKKATAKKASATNAPAKKTATKKTTATKAPAKKAVAKKAPAKKTTAKKAPAKKTAKR